MDGTRNAHCAPGIAVAEMVEQIIGCKWSVSVLGCLRRGVLRPGALERAIPGISTKMLNERLRRFLSFGIVDKTVYPVSPYHVEYRLTAFGAEFVRILDVVDELQQLLDVRNGGGPASAVDSDPRPEPRTPVHSE